MDILKKLSPAEVKLLLEPNKSKVTELLKVTFIDLLLKQILKVEIKEETVHISKQVSVAPKFHSHDHFEHEKLFTDVFKQSPDLVLTLYETMRLVKAEINTSKDFKWAYLILPRMEQYFKGRTSPKLFEFFTGIRLNESGLKLQTEISSFLDGFSKKVNDRSLTIEEVKVLYNSIGTNFILIDGFDSSYLKEIFEELKPEKDKKGRNYLPIDDLTVRIDSSEKDEKTFDIPAIPILGGVLIFEMLEQIESLAESVSESFSSSFDTFDSKSWAGDDSRGWFSGDSDGWGDSGGDSGCSGCGGCGGD